MRLATLRRSAALILSVAQTTYAQSSTGRNRSCDPASGLATGAPAVIPMEVSNNHVYVKVCAGTRELEFILDTGAGQTLLDLNTAKQLGVKLGSTFTSRGAGAGTAAGARLDGAVVTLAGTAIEQTVPAALDVSRLPAREGHRVDGILGYDFISRSVLAIDYVRQELRMYDRRSLRYPSGELIPLTFINQHPHIDAQVKLADGETVGGRFIVDVGASTGLTLTKPFVDEHRLRGRVGPTVRRQSGGGVGGPVTSEIGRAASLKLGRLELANPIVQLFGDSAGVFSERGSWIGNIGGDVLRRFTVFLDYESKTMVLDPNDALYEPFEADMSGLAIVMNETLSSMIVGLVVPGSPAADAGLARGDSVVAVDGAPPTAGALNALRRRFRRAGEHVMLTIRRGGETKTVEIVTRRLV